MRNNKALDYWDSIEKANDKSYSCCSSINLSGINGFGSILLANKLQVFCGLNGAGKSTILAAIKSIIGVDLSEQDNLKIADKKAISSVTGTIRFHGTVYECENNAGKRLLDQLDLDCLKYLQYYDYFNILRILDFICKEPNLEDFLESNESISLPDNQIQEINYLIGKEYKNVTVYVIEDITELGVVPFFTVEEANGIYDSRKMGTGEYSLLYLYWNIQQSKKSIILIEEPESFIAIDSQRKLMNFIAKSISKNGNSYIISTHSPFILNNVKDKYIKIISRAYGKTVVSVPSMKNASELLGLKENGVGLIFVEDDMAKAFLEILFQKENIPLNKYYDIKIANGSTELSKLLSLDMLRESPLSFIGLYDDDQRELIPEEVVLPFAFLPPKKDVESSFKELLTTEKNFESLYNVLGVNEEIYINILSKLSGKDRHDWFSAFAKEINMAEQVLLDKVYDLWKNDNSLEIDDFKQRLIDLTGIPEF